MSPKNKLYTAEEIENAWGMVGIPPKHGLTKLLHWFITRNMQTTEVNIREGVSKVTDLSADECDQFIDALRFSTQDIEAMFANAPVETNAVGAKQSKLDVRYDLISPVAIQKLAHVLWYGAQRYGVNNWHGIPVNDHLSHMIYHAYAYLAGEEEEDHLSHMLARAMMAVDRADAEAQPKVDETIGEMLYTRTQLQDACVAAGLSLHNQMRVLGKLEQTDAIDR